MALVLNTNIASLSAQRSLNSSQAMLQTAMQRLSSGLRINSARDDAAGLAISDRLTTQIRGLNQATRNANDGISLTQIAEGAMTESTNNLQRIRELAVQAINDTNSSTDRAALNNEVTQLIAEMERAATSTQFNGVNLLNGDFVSKTLQVGAYSGQEISVSISDYRTTALGSYSIASSTAAGGPIQATAAATALAATRVAAQDLYISGSIGGDTVAVAAGDSAYTIVNNINDVSGNTGVTASVNTTAALLSSFGGGNANSTMTAVTFSLYGKNTSAANISVSMSYNTTDLSAMATAINAQTNTTGITAAVVSGDNTKLVLSSADGYNIRIANFDTDQNSNTAGNAAQTISFAGLSSVDDATSNVGAAVTLNEANVDSSSVGGSFTFTSSSAISLSTYDTGTTTAYTSDTLMNTGGDGLMTSTQTLLSDISITTKANAKAALAVIDAALDQFNSGRSTLGSLQNRLLSSSNNNTITSENLTNARSRIMDADFSAETASMTKNNILQQAGISVLAQANQLPQSILKLLQ